MISIIICSTKSHLNYILDRNIQETIGVDYEVIFIDNSDNKYSIFSAYNEGVKQSKYPYLCFIHEDIIFRSNNWGKLLCKAFETSSKIGMIGVIGAKMIFDYTWGWWTAPQVGKIIQSNKTTRITSKYTQCLDEHPILLNAAICDGLFLAFPKIIFDQISFDENTYKGFHGYDMDISMQVLVSGYEIKVIQNILVEHFSLGSINESFIDACYLFNNKWSRDLPIACSGISSEKIEDYREHYIKDIFRFCPQKNILKSKRWKLFRWLTNIIHK